MGAVSTYASLGKAISRHRARLGMTQQNLADAVGISRASIANIERGDQRVYFDQVLSFKDALGLTSVEDLMSGAALEKTVVHALNISGDHLKRSEKRTVRDLVERYAGAD